MERKKDKDMGSLVEVLKDSGKRAAVIADCEQLLEAEVADKKGLSGMGVKGAFKIVKKFKPGMVRLTLDDMIDEFAEKVDPFWKECQESGVDASSFFQRKKVMLRIHCWGLQMCECSALPIEDLKRLTLL